MSRKNRAFLIPVGIAVASLLGSIGSASAVPQQKIGANLAEEFVLASSERPRQVDLILAPQQESSTIMVAGHRSHGSHGSHGSHSSHRSGQ